MFRRLKKVFLRDYKFLLKMCAVWVHLKTCRACYRIYLDYLYIYLPVFQSRKNFGKWITPIFYKQLEPNRDSGGCLAQQGITHDFIKYFDFLWFNMTKQD